MNIPPHSIFNSFPSYTAYQAGNIKSLSKDESAFSDKTEDMLMDFQLAIAGSESEKYEIFEKIFAKSHEKNLPTSWLFIGYGLLLKANADKGQLTHFTESYLKIEKQNLNTCNFVKGYLEKVEEGATLSELNFWVNYFIDFEKEEKKLQDFRESVETIQEDDNTSKTGYKDILMRLLVNPVSLLIKAAGTLITLILS